MTARARKRESSAQQTERRRKYSAAIGQVRPKPRYALNMAKAFLVGGLICAVGQFVMEVFEGVEKTSDEVIATTQAAMIFIGAVLTDLGVYDRFGAFSGMGAAVPITGFSNTIVAAAIDFRREGWIAGMASKMFIIAGPVLVFGIITGFSVGLITMITKGLSPR